MIEKIIIVVITAFLLNVAFIPMLIPMLNRLKFGQFVRNDGPKNHFKKQGTPTIGGISFIVVTILVSLIFVDITPDVISVLALMVLYAGLGFIDDALKVIFKRSLGLRAYQKIVLQFLIAGLFGYYLVTYSQAGTDIIIPFMGGKAINIGEFFIPLVIIAVVATVNSVNLTDGLDGLATTVTLPVLLFFIVIGIQNASGTSIVSAAMFGALLGYLIYNAYPAKLFMGDTGSHALGGLIIGIAFINNMPLFVVIIGIIYVMEAISDILQVMYYRTFKKRLFKMAPIHHHFELLGWHETKVVSVFFIISILACFIGYLGVVISIL
ncbi:MAG: phospho-N-acetylmuramoyl-pentapeptide-transferase [Clostridia bacterium]|jgi:phospho-N-acetylmuramoyl-pentapeptide-transferase|nr:phospho-N-acetylmuramoyl-pentapeptide-transferase [Clostridia bacterium]